MRYVRSIVVMTSALSLATMAWADPGPHQDGRQPAFSAGEPGDPKKPARVIQVTMKEADSRMLFVPEKIEVKKDEQIKFVLRNVGELDHEFVLATTAENLKHAEAMRDNAGMEHEEPNGKVLAPKKSGELLWKFTRPGRFEYGCLIPGHRESGMIGTIAVR